MSQQSKYKGVNDATGNSKHPFHSEVGTHIVAIQSWSCPQSRKPGPTLGQYLDILEWGVVKTLAGDASAVGMTRTRIRPVLQMGAMDEVKSRAQVVSTVAARSAGAPPDFEFPLSSVTDALLDAITDENGRRFVGVLVKIEVNEVPTKAGKMFTAISYSVPTAADLDGINGVVNGRLAA